MRIYQNDQTPRNTIAIPNAITGVTIGDDDDFLMMSCYGKLSYLSSHICNL